jgi:GT2 family glycosyltransferase
MVWALLHYMSATAAGTPLPIQHGVPPPRVTGGVAHARAGRGRRPLVSVVVPVYDHDDRLPALLRALDAQRYDGEWEVVVVDNGARGDVPAMVARSSRARLVHEERVGSYAARNRGVRAARGEVIAFTDADCRPAPDWLACGVESLTSEHGCGLVAGRIDVEVADPQRPTAAELYECAAAFRQHEYVERWRFGATANLFTHRAVFELVGPFDEDLHSLGDRDWGRRVAAAGLRLRYADDARVHHPARRSLGQLVGRARRMAGGYVQIARSRRASPLALLRDAPMGLLPLRQAGRNGRRGGLPPGRRRAAGARERAAVAAVAITILAVRGLEVLRLLAGGRPRRA